MIKQKILCEYDNSKYILNIPVDMQIINILNQIKITKGLVEIVTTTLNEYGIVIQAKTNVKLLITIFNFVFDNNSKFVKLNDTIMKNKRLHEKYNNILVSRNHCTFFQTFYDVSNKIHACVLEWNNDYSDKILLGGEMYYYGLLLQNYYDKIFMYSDFDSIIQDAEINMKYLKEVKKVIIKKINYNDVIFDHTENLIVNISKSGLKKNLCKQLKSKQITIISCNEKSFERDYNMLKHKYYLFKKLNIINYNSFSITIYLLKHASCNIKLA
jgi:tRNA/tmRNA/rRNA uracil-C5-methylase (TrmA/RlmC/RlmD family)